MAFFFRLVCKLNGAAMHMISLKTIWRNIVRNKAFSSINILGLAIGISASLVIYLIVSYHTSFDKFEKDGQLVYRVVSEMKFAGQMYYNPGVPEPLAQAIDREVTGVAATIPFLQPNFDMKVSIAPDAQRPTVFRKQKDIIFTGDQYLRLLSFQWLAGNISSTNTPSTVTLTESRAKTYFPHLSPAETIGQRIIYNDSISVSVAGVVKDIPGHSDFPFKEFLSLPTMRVSGFREGYAPDEWYSTNGTTQLFIKLMDPSPATKAKVFAQLNGLIRKYRKDQLQDGENAYILRLQALDDIHFDANYGTYVQWDSAAHSSAVSRRVLYGLMTTAALLLLLGCVNFINLATAQAAQRAKEVGIRKTMGSSRGQLRWHFIQETFIITLVAATLSLALVPLLLKAFGDFIPKGVQFNLVEQPVLLVFWAGLVVVVTLLAGFYPSMILSGYNPIEALKNRTGADGSTRKTRVRTSLTVAQLTVAQVFIMVAIVVGNQMHYMLSTDMGFKKDAIIYFYIGNSSPDNGKRLVLQERLRSIPGISMTSLSNDPPSSTSRWTGVWSYKDGQNNIETSVHMKYGDSSYTRLFGMRLLAGRQLTGGDSARTALINETYAHLLGFRSPEAAIDKFLIRKDTRIRIAGVVGDFNQSSMHDNIKPLVITSRTSDEYCMNILLAGSSKGWPATIDRITAQYKELYPQQELEYHFLDDSIARFYEAERDISVLINWATALAIIISCMGLLGLVVYTTNTRTKEIGIRKTLGASVGSVVTLLSKDFVRLVGIAFLIAAPLASWVAWQWLAGFAYRTAISWWIFLLTGCCMLVVALLTLSVRVIRAALTPPVKSLRSE